MACLLPDDKHIVCLSLTLKNLVTTDVYNTCSKYTQGFNDSDTADTTACQIYLRVVLMMALHRFRLLSKAIESNHIIKYLSFSDETPYKHSTIGRVTI